MHRYWGYGDLHTFSELSLNKDVKSTLRAMWDRTIALSPVSTILMFRLETDVLPLCQEREKMGLDPVWWSSALWALGGSVVYRDQYFSLPLVTCDPSSIQLLSNFYIFRLKGVSERNRVVTLPTVLLLLSLPVTTFVSRLEMMLSKFPWRFAESMELFFIFRLRKTSTKFGGHLPVEDVFFEYNVVLLMYI